MLGRTWAVVVKNETGVGANVYVQYRLWRFTSSGSREYSPQVYSGDYSVPAGGATFIGVDNSTDKWLGGEFLCVATPSGSASGAVRFFLARADTLVDVVKAPTVSTLLAAVALSGTGAKSASATVDFGLSSTLSTLGAHWRVDLQQDTGSAHSLEVRVYPWRLDATNQLEFGTQLALINASVSSGSVVTSSVVTNDATPFVGATGYVYLPASFAGRLRLWLRRSTNGTTFPAAGDGIPIMDAVLAAGASPGTIPLTFGY